MKGGNIEIALFQPDFGIGQGNANVDSNPVRL